MSSGVIIEEKEFSKLKMKDQNLVIYKVVKSIVIENSKIKTRQKLLGLGQLGIYAFLGWLMYIKL